MRRLFLFTLFLIIVISGCDDSVTNESSRQKSISEFLSSDVQVLRDSTGTSPLTAELHFKTSIPTRVNITVQGDQPVTHTFSDIDTTHVVPILGLYAETDNKVELRLVDSDLNYAVDTLTIPTDPIPDYFPTIEIKRADKSLMEPGMTLSHLSLGDDGAFRTIPIMYDDNGDIRWYLNTHGMAYLIKRYQDGNIWFGQDDRLYHYDMLGHQLSSTQFPDYLFHHELTRKPDGNFIAAVSKKGLDTIEDHIIEINPESGSIVRKWDLRQILDIDRSAYPSYNRKDWFHMNAIDYDETDNTLIISGRNQGVIKVDMQNNLQWILAPHKGWDKAGLDSSKYNTADYLLSAVNANGEAYPESVQLGNESPDHFGWVWGQHAPMLLPNGNIFLFDNGFWRNYSGAVKYSRGVEFQVNEDNMTVKQVWQYGKTRGKDFFSTIISDVDLLPSTGNRMIMPGVVTATETPHAYVTEVTYPSAQKVFEAELKFKNQLSTGSGWGQLDIVYRSDRMPLYPK